jgi:hypothetical protein
MTDLRRLSDSFRFSTQVGREEQKFSTSVRTVTKL